jgi:hypothetical protein
LLSEFYKALSSVAVSIGASPKEYLLRFGKALSENAEAVFNVFEKQENISKV